MEQILSARKAILDDLKRRFQAGDKTVKPATNQSPHGEGAQGNYFSGAGTIDCPICKTGKLRYSRAAYNGHVHAACSSPDCVRWME